MSDYSGKPVKNEHQLIIVTMTDFTSFDSMRHKCKHEYVLLIVIRLRNILSVYM